MVRPTTLAAVACIVFAFPYASAGDSGYDSDLDA